MSPADPSLPDDAARKLIRNERAKLTATYVNGLAIAVFAVGALTLPMNSAMQGSPSSYVVGAAVVCVAASMALHSIARLILGGLR